MGSMICRNASVGSSSGRAASYLAGWAMRSWRRSVSIWRGGRAESVALKNAVARGDYVSLDLVEKNLTPLFSNFRE